MPPVHVTEVLLADSGGVMFEDAIFFNNLFMYVYDWAFQDQLRIAPKLSVVMMQIPRNFHIKYRFKLIGSIFVVGPFSTIDG